MIKDTLASKGCPLGVPHAKLVPHPASCAAAGLPVTRAYPNRWQSHLTLVIDQAEVRHSINTLALSNLDTSRNIQVV